MKKINYALASIAILVIMIIVIIVPNPFMRSGENVRMRDPLAERSFSMENRYNNSFVNSVFRDNILLTLGYLNEESINPNDVDWKNVNNPNVYEFTLKPGETFAFHDDVLTEYKGKISKTSNAHFNAIEGFRSSGFLYGDGVCHLASFLYWVALDAGLEVNAPTKHSFAKIPEVPGKYGVSIYATPGSQMRDQVQNLYITNNKENDVTFEFVYDGASLKIAALIAPQKLASR